MIVACGLLDSDCLDSGFSDSGSANLQGAGLRFAPLDLSTVDLKTAEIRPVAGCLGLVRGLKLSGAGMLWQLKEEQGAGPEPDYSEGA